MKGTVTIVFSAKEVKTLIANKEFFTKGFNKKVVEAFVTSQVTPIGRKNAIVASASSKKSQAVTSKKKPVAKKNTIGNASSASVATSSENQAVQ